MDSWLRDRITIPATPDRRARTQFCQEVMPIEFHCYLCGQRLRVADQHHGQRARCPRCEAVLDIPDASLEEPAAPILLGSARSKADVIDYELFGHESQYVEVTLDPGEIAIADVRSMFYMSPGIEMEVVVADAPPPAGGLLERLAQAGRQFLSGESLSMTAFCNMATQREVVAFAPHTPGKLVPMHLDEMGEAIICQRDALLCVARGIEISTFFEHTSRESLVLQRLIGDGIAVLHASGSVVHRMLKPNQNIHVNTQSIVAMTPQIGYELHGSGGVYGEGMSITTLSGPGELWLRSTIPTPRQE